jgi:membrane protein
LSLTDLIRSTAFHVREDRLSVFAGNLTYNAFLAFFPFMLFLVSLLKVARATSLVTTLVDTMSRTLPSSAATLVRQQILPEVLSRLTSNPILSAFLALGSLWAASAVARAVMEAMNVMYGVKHSRSLWFRLLLSILLSAGAAVLFLAALALIVFGPFFAVRMSLLTGHGTILRWTWNVGQWLLLLVIALLAFASIYYFAPNVEHRSRFVSLGALVATGSWIIFSLIFSFVLNQFGNRLIDPLYGWFAGVIILLMYMYWSSLILLAGGEINRVIESHASERAFWPHPSRSERVSPDHSAEKEDRAV